MEMNQESKTRFLDLYCMVLADGEVHPKELETLYRIGTETYGLTEEEIARSVVSAGKTGTIPELPEEKIRLLYEMCLIAYADGRIDQTERDMLRRYALRYGVVEDQADSLVNFLLEHAKDNVSEDKVIEEMSK